jgi:hypothetical protein
MKTIQMMRWRWLLVGVLLGMVQVGRAQRRLPAGGTTVPPVSGQTTQNQSSSEYNRPPGPLVQTDDADVSVRGNLDAMRASLASKERQRAMTRDAAMLLQMTADLQTKIAQNQNDMSLAEMTRQLDAIEKLARSVKDKMKGAR